LLAFLLKMHKFPRPFIKQKYVYFVFEKRSQLKTKSFFYFFILIQKYF